MFPEGVLKATNFASRADPVDATAAAARASSKKRIGRRRIAAIVPWPSA